MKRGTPDHPKLGMLQERLKIKKREAVGIMELMFHFTAQYCPQGDIGKFDDERIAAALDWDTRKAAALMDGLVDAGLLDEMDGARLYVHDWHEHCDDAVHMRLARQVLLFANGKRPKLNRLGSEDKQRILQEYVRTASAQDTHGVRTASAIASAIVSASLPTLSRGEGKSESENLRSETPEGDEAHRILTAVPVLRCITWEDDLKARQFAAGLDFLKAAPVIARDAEMWMGDMGQPVLWLRKQYIRLIAEKGSEKKERAGPRDVYVPFKDRKPEDIP